MLFFTGPFTKGTPFAATMATSNRASASSVCDVKDAVLTKFAEHVDVSKLKNLGKGNITDLTIEACLNVCLTLFASKGEQSEELIPHLQLVQTVFVGPIRKNAVRVSQGKPGGASGGNTPLSANPELATQLAKMKGYFEELSPEVRKRLREFPGAYEVPRAYLNASRTTSLDEEPHVLHCFTSSPRREGSVSRNTVRSWSRIRAISHKSR